MKKLNIVLFLSIALITLGCKSSDKQEYDDSQVFSYRILEKEDFSLKKNEEIKFYKASILLNLPDTIVTYISIAKSANVICKNENFIAAKFYKNEKCWNMEIGKEAMDKDFYSKGFIGHIDNTNKGVDWKSKIEIEDFRFNDRGRLPMKIEVK